MIHLQRRRHRRRRRIGAAAPPLAAWRRSPRRRPSTRSRRRATITIGMLVDFPPFGIIDAQNQPDGYDADVAKLLAKDLGRASSTSCRSPARTAFPSC